jgi:hypothetical protein
MSDSKSSSASGGLGLCSVLTIIFVVLKVLGVAPVATWGWLWVLSPLWIGFLAGLGLLLLFGLIALVVALFSKVFS